MKKHISNDKSATRATGSNVMAALLKAPTVGTGVFPCVDPIPSPASGMIPCVDPIPSPASGMIPCVDPMPSPSSAFLDFIPFTDEHLSLIAMIIASKGGFERPLPNNEATFDFEDQGIELQDMSEERTSSPRPGL